MEYTLQDTHDELRELESERQRELDQLADSIANNRISGLNPSVISDEVWPKKLKFARHFLENLVRQEPSEYPAPGTADLRVEVLKELEKEIEAMKELEKSMEAEFADIRENIAYLKKKQAGLRKMKQANLEVSTTTFSKSHAQEKLLLKRINQETKQDLRDVVDLLFPNNDQMTDVLADLSAAYTKGGDDMYIDVVPRMNSCMAFLFTNDIIQYHRNDKTKVKLTEML